MARSVRLGKAYKATELRKAQRSKIQAKYNTLPILEAIRKDFTVRVTAACKRVIERIRKRMLETQRSPRGTVYTLESLAQIPEENVPEKMWDRVLRDGSYQASAPGQVPNILSEALFKSMSVEVEVPSGPVTNDNALNINGTIAINSPYAAKLEFGSVEDNLEPRPFIVPAFEEARRPVKNYMSVPAHIQEAGQDAFLSKFFSGKIK